MDLGECPNLTILFGVFYMVFLGFAKVLTQFRPFRGLQGLRCLPILVHALGAVIADAPLILGRLAPNDHVHQTHTNIIYLYVYILN